MIKRRGILEKCLWYFSQIVSHNYVTIVDGRFLEERLRNGKIYGCDRAETKHQANNRK